MLTSITPLGERGRANRYGLTAGAYIAGSVVGGALAGLTLGSLGSLALGDVSARTLLVALVGGATLAAALDLAAQRPPSWHRQVDENWMHAYRGTVYGAGYGVQLGAGVATIVTSATVYAAGLSWLLSASPLAGTALGALFGLARGVPLLAARRATTAAALGNVHRRLVRAERPARLLGAGAAALVAVLALLSAVGGTG